MEAVAGTSIEFSGRPQDSALGFHRFSPEVLWAEAK